MSDPDRRHSSGASDYDAIFADIVAHLNDDLTEDEQPVRPARGETETKADAVAAPVAAPVADPDTDADSSSGSDAPVSPAAGQVDQKEPLDQRNDADDEPGPVPQVWRAHEVEDYEDHFEPPPANPLPAGDLQFWAIIAGMGGGPLLLLYLVFFNRDASSYWILTAIALCVGGFALLVTRMPGNNEDDDDGARL